MRVRGLLLGAVSFAFLALVLNPIQMLSVLVRPFSKARFRALNRWCAGFIWGWWTRMARPAPGWPGIEFRFSGDPIPTSENALLLPNHQSMADVLVILEFGRRAERLSDLKWFVKDPIKWIPGPGWGMKFLDCIFVRRNWSQDRAQIERLFFKFRQEDIPISLVSFLEGTRFTPEKHEASLSFAKERGLPRLEHTLLPRTKGFVASVLGLKGHLDAVHDLTIVYPDQATLGRVPTLFDCFAGRVKTVEVFVRRFSAAELADQEDALARFAFQRFEEKDERLSTFFKIGTFEAPSTEPAQVQDDAEAEVLSSCIHRSVC